MSARSSTLPSPYRSAMMQYAILRAVDAVPEATMPVVGEGLLVDIEPAGVRQIDLSILSPLLPEERWQHEALPASLLQTAAHAIGMASTRYGEYRMTESALRASAPMPTFALHVDLCLPTGDCRQGTLCRPTRMA